MSPTKNVRFTISALLCATNSRLSLSLSPVPNPSDIKLLPSSDDGSTGEFPPLMSQINFPTLKREQPVVAPAFIVQCSSATEQKLMPAFGNFKWVAVLNLPRCLVEDYLIKQSATDYVDFAVHGQKFE